MSKIFEKIACNQVYQYLNNWFTKVIIALGKIFNRADRIGTD